METAKRRGIGFLLLRQSIVILCLAFGLSLSVNQLRSDRLALVADWSPEAQLALDSGESLIISFDEAQGHFFAGDAVFVDARSPELYDQGHIEGARNLPWEHFEQYYEGSLADLPPDALIIAYCDGEGCSLSKELALALFDKGHRNVRVLVNGWGLWTERGLPVEMDPSFDVS